MKPAALQINQSRSVTNALAGQVAGIIAVQRSGEPGNDASDFWIRGISSFGSGTTPLVLVDGIERSLSNLSPEEIESFFCLEGRHRYGSLWCEGSQRSYPDTDQAWPDW